MPVGPYYYSRPSTNVGPNKLTEMEQKDNFRIQTNKDLRSRTATRPELFYLFVLFVESKDINF